MFSRNANLQAGFEMMTPVDGAATGVFLRKERIDETQSLPAPVIQFIGTPCSDWTKLLEWGGVCVNGCGAVVRARSWGKRFVGDRRSVTRTTNIQL